MTFFHRVPQGSFRVLPSQGEFKDLSDRGCRATFYQIYIFINAWVLVAVGSWGARNLLWSVVSFRSINYLDIEELESLWLCIEYKEHG